MSSAGEQPTELNTSNHGPGLEIAKDKLSIRYVGDGRHNNDVGSIQANRPVPHHQLVYYFEITVLDQGEAGRIGLGFSDKTFKVTRQPGWEPNSYGYHGDDGHKFCSTGTGADYGPKFGTGDTVGACLHFRKQEIFFTKNGTKLKTAFRQVACHNLYPTVGLHSKNEHVQVNLGQQPFKFDLEGYLIEEQAQQHAAIQQVDVAAGDAHQVVRNYLLHYGYGDTLAAFDAAAGAEGIAEPMSVGEDPMASTLHTRQAVREAIMSGQVVQATELLRRQCPAVLSGHACSDEVHFHLSCQQYIELIREGRVDDAMQFAQTVLADVKAGAAHKESQLREVVALIAYEQPEHSPLSHLLHRHQRERVADIVNAAVLQASSAVVAAANGRSGGDGHLDSSTNRPLCALEVLLRQLVAARQALRDEQGGVGEVFALEDHLIRC